MNLKLFCWCFVVDRGIEPLCQDWESCILTSRWIHHCVSRARLLRKLGDSNPRYDKLVRQFSKLLVSATHPNFPSDNLYRVVLSQTRCKGTTFFLYLQIFSHFFFEKVEFSLFFPRKWVFLACFTLISHLLQLFIRPVGKGALWFKIIMAGHSG